MKSSVYILLGLYGLILFLWGCDGPLLKKEIIFQDIGCNLMSQANGEEQVISFYGCNYLPTRQKLNALNRMLSKLHGRRPILNLALVEVMGEGTFCDAEYLLRMAHFTAEKLAEQGFMRDHQDLIIGEKKNQLQDKYLYDHSGVFEEFYQVFEEYGHELRFLDYQKDSSALKSDYDHITNNPKLRHVDVPCRSRLYFKARPLTEKGKPWPE